MLSSQPPVPHNVKAFGDRAFKEAFKVKCGHVTRPVFDNWCSYKKRSRHGHAQRDDDMKT